MSRPANSRADHGITMATEFSAAFLDCGLFLRSTSQTPIYQGDCTLWDDYRDWGLGIKASLMQFVGAQMDALRDWFYFNWKVRVPVIMGSHIYPHSRTTNLLS